MGVAKGYGWHDLEAFITSWRQNASHNSDLVLFIDDTSDWTRACMTAQGEGLRLVDIPRQFRDKQVVTVRWSIYKNYLDAHENECDQILLTDVRDVIFQSDPFNDRRYEKFFCYATEGEFIGKSEENTTWMIKFFGENAFNELKERIIICAGTVMATFDEIRLFLSMMENSIAHIPEWGADQAALNYFVYSGRLPFEHIIEHNIVDGNILTLAHGGTGTRGDQIVNHSGAVPAVVHMYNHYPPLRQISDRLYRSDGLLPLTAPDVEGALDFVQAVVFRSGMSTALDVMIYILEHNEAPEHWHGSFNRLTRIFQDLLSSTSASFVAELVEQTVCVALMRVFDGRTPDTGQLNQMLYLISSAKKKNYTVYRSFEQKINFAVAEFYRQVGDKDKALDFYKKSLDA